MTRPLFSVVISCYKSDKYLDRLLSSITKQGLKKSEIEVIISDDYSYPEIEEKDLYADIIDRYKKKIIIRKIISDRNYGYPAHTRDQGAYIATGEWLTFADHDDQFLKGSFKKIKKYIKNNNPQYEILTGCVVHNIYSKETSEPQKTNAENVTHGIFFNLDNLWIKYKIHYDWEHLTTMEDKYINSVVNNITHYNELEVDDLNEKVITYKYFQSNDQTSSGFNIHNRDNRGANSYIPYLRSSIMVYIEYYNKYQINYFDFFYPRILSYIGEMYFWYQSMKYNDKIYHLDIDWEYINDHTKIIMDIIKKNLMIEDMDDLFDLIEYPVYKGGYTTITSMLGPFIIQQNMKEWFHYIDDMNISIDEYREKYNDDYYDKFKNTLTSGD